MGKEERFVLVTGASRGIGYATSKLFAERGWHVLSVSRSNFSNNHLCALHEDNHIQIDLSDLSKIDLLVSEVRKRLTDGKLHALINNAGISLKSPGKKRLGILETDKDVWCKTLNTNLVSAALLTRAVLPELISAGGSIVNVTSIAGVRVHPYAGVAYAVSKAGLTALTREMAYEFGALGLRANSVSPGEIDTSILSSGTDELVDKVVPMRRLGKPHEVASSIYFLCSSNSSYINGAELSIDGGQRV